MIGKQRITFLLAVAAICVLVLTGCVPGDYSVNSLAREPEATLTYPGSTDVSTHDYPGRVQFGLDGGEVAETGTYATTTHTQGEVIAYYSRALAAASWDQIMDNAHSRTATDQPAHAIQWWKTKPHLSYSLLVWTEGTLTKYRTDIRAMR